MTFAEQRQKANLEILRLMTDLVERNPDIRFTQWLVNLGIIETNGDGTAKDPFYVESTDSLEAVKKALNLE